MNTLWDEIKLSADEYGEFYQTYIDKVGAGNILDILLNQVRITYTLVTSLSPEEALYRYEQGKWTVKEVIGHMIDTERVFAYRGMCFSRGETKELPGYDQDRYVANSGFNDRSLQSLANEYSTLRNATVHFFRSLSKDALTRHGRANDVEFTVRAIPFIIAGHERHHLDILKTRYALNTI